jgi:hypothetical protein
MAYVALTEVSDMEGYFKDLVFSQATTPSHFQVTAWINEGTALLYRYVGQKYSIPITDQSDLLILKSIVERYVLQHINYVLVRSGKIAIEDGKMPTSVNLSGFYSEAASIASGKTPLLSTQRTSTLATYNDMTDSDTFTKTITKDGDNW